MEERFAAVQPPINTAEGRILPVLANAIAAFRHAPEWGGVLAFNEFGFGTVVLKPAPLGHRTQRGMDRSRGPSRRGMASATRNHGVSRGRWTSCTDSGVCRQGRFRVHRQRGQGFAA